MIRPILFASAAADEASSLTPTERVELLAALKSLAARGEHPFEIEHRGRLRALVVPLKHRGPGKQMIVVFRLLSKEELHRQGRTGYDAGFIVYHIGVVDDPKVLNAALDLAEARLDAAG